MLNENYRRFTSYYMSKGSYDSGYSHEITLTPYRYESSGLPEFPFMAWRRTYAPYTPSVHSLSLIVGDGSTPPTDKDFQLENEIQGLTCTTASASGGGNTLTVKTVSLTFKNNTTDTKTITEVGLIIQTNGSDKYCAALLGRVVLDVAVVMKPGDTYTFTYCIE